MGGDGIEVREQAYEEFCSQVCSAMKKATQKEKQDLSRELADHMEDHVEALVELGWDPDEARDYAVEAMGDPEIVGRQYDEKLSSFWLWCGYLLRGVAVILVVFMVWMLVVYHGALIYQNLRTRWTADPEWIQYTVDHEILNRQTLDLEIPLGKHTIRIFRTEVYYDERWESYAARVYVACYSHNPFDPLSHLMRYAVVEGFDPGGGIEHTSAGYFAYYGKVAKGQESVMFTIQRGVTDTDIRVEVPLNWEGIP